MQGNKYIYYLYQKQQPQNLFNVTYHETQNQYHRTVMERTERSLKSSEVNRKYEFSNIVME